MGTAAEPRNVSLYLAALSSELAGSAGFLESHDGSVGPLCGVVDVLCRLLLVVALKAGESGR